MSAINMAKRTAAGTLALAVCLGGGALALAGAAQADANFKFDTRIAGDDRYQTAIAASKAAFPDGTKTDNVVLVNGFATVDGLTASYLAGVANAPILYVSDKGADDATKAEIKRLGAKNVWLVGGTTVIPASVEAAIKGDGYNVTRINGSDRYETAKLVAEAGTKIAGKKPAKVFVASGDSFADALAVSPIAYAKGYAIALTQKDSTSQFTKDELGAIGTDAKYLVGGEAVVSKKVQADLSISDAQRIAGADRAVTANLVSDWAKKSEGFNPANAALVGGTNGNGADSLVASALGAKSFTTLHFAGWDATNVYLKDHSAELTGKGFVFGGKAAVSEGQVTAAQSAAQTVAVISPFVVTDVASKATGTFSYADPAQDKAVSASFGTTDTFQVGGTSATIATFRAALTVGDTVEVLKDSAGKTTFKLVQKEDGDYTSGLVGGTINSSQIQIVEPVTGTVLSTVGTTGNYTLYTVDGSAVSATLFNSAVNAGDSVKTSGGGTGASDIRTIALTNVTLKGKVAGLSGANFNIQGDKGAVIGVFTAASSGDTLTVDGVTKSQADFNAALSNGDSVTFSKNGGVQTIALVNAAPPLVNGQASGAATVAGGQLVSLPFVPAGKAATTAVPLVVGVTAATSTPGSSSAIEVQTLTFASAPYGKVKKLSFTYAGSTLAATDGKTITVDIPSTGDATADSTTLASRLQTAVRAIDTSTPLASATVAATSTTVLTITYGGNSVVSDVASATSVTPFDITVDGSVATVAEAQAALTLGDSVKYQASDLQTKTTARLEITTAAYAGVVKPDSVNTAGGAEAVAIYADGSASVALGSAVDFTSTTGSGLFATAGTVNYVLNGGTATTSATAFKSALDGIKNGALKGSLKVTQSDSKTVYSLTTSNA